jgi:pimeloyl-ACP methyl ester carboxylesterase
MSRRSGIVLGIIAVLLVVVVGGAVWLNSALFGIPAFIAWRATTGQFHGGHRAAVNGISLYYETYGVGRPVLVLHGAGASLETMHYFIRDLAADHMVIAPDSRAQGRSTDAPGPLTYSKMGADMIALLDTLHVRQADVIGWSDGGIIGLDMAMKHPDRVRRLVAIGANYDASGVPADAFSSSEVREAEKGAKSLYDLLAPDPKHYPVVMAKIETMIKTEPRYRLADLAHILSPTLIVAGERDLILRGHTDAMAHAIPGAKEIIVQGASHIGPLEKPDQYNAMARSFLDK